MVDQFKEQKELDKRVQNSKAVLIVFTKREISIKEEIQFFNVVDEHGSTKYDGHFDIAKLSDTDYCSCPSYTNNNFSKTEGWYKDTHGHAFQCKHIIAARDEYKKQKAQVEFLEISLVKEPPIGNTIDIVKTEMKDGTTFYESKLIQRDLLL